MIAARMALAVIVLGAMLLGTGIAAAKTPAPESDEAVATSASPSPQELEEEPEEEPQEDSEDMSVSSRCWSGDLAVNGVQGGHAGCSPFVWGETVRVVVRCDGYWPWSDYTRYGPWVSSNVSEAFCDAGDDREWHNFQSSIAT